MKGSENSLHRDRDGVVLGEAVALKQRLEHWPGDEVLGEHFDSVGLADPLVQVIPDLGKEALECRALGRSRLLNDGRDTGDMGLGDLGDVARPVLPIVTPPALLHDLGADRRGELVEGEGKLVTATIGRRAAAVAIMVCG